MSIANYLRQTTLLALMGALAAPSIAGPVLDRIKQRGRIVIAHRESSIPFSYVLPDGRPVGYAIDLCLRLAEALRKKAGMPVLTPEFMLVTPANRIDMVAQGKADIECGSTTNNAERREKVAFTIPHYIAGARYMVRADSSITELAGFSNLKLVSTKATTPMKVIEKANRDQLLKINILEAPDHARAVAMVLGGEADGFVMDDVLLYGLIAGQADPSKLKVVGKFLTIEPLAMMIAKGDPEFKRILDDEMRRLIYSREAYEIYDRWFMRPIPPKNTALKLPMNYLLRDFWKYPTDAVPN